MLMAVTSVQGQMSLHRGPVECTVGTQGALWSRGTLLVQEPRTHLALARQTSCCAHTLLLACPCSAGDTAEGPFLGQPGLVWVHPRQCLCVVDEAPPLCPGLCVLWASP